MPTLTVFTPTYNRKELLARGYEALCRQTSKDFLWLVVDDGSTDDTESQVKIWQAQADFEIRYIYKKNGGLCSGYNTAIANLDTELAICIDSDDFMPDNGVEIIVDYWEKNGSENYGGIVGLDYTLDNEILGNPFPNQKSINSIDLAVGRYPENQTDCKYVVRSELYKKYAPIPEIEDERDLNPHMLHMSVGKEMDFLVLNENLCFVEYQPDGMTNAIFKQYVRSPKSYAYMRIFNLGIKNAPIKFRIKNAIHYVSSCILSKDGEMLKKSPQKFLTFLMIPLGALFTLYVKRRAKK